MTSNWQQRLRAIKRLERGDHAPASGRLSITEAAAAVAGEAHSSKPKTVSPTIAGFAQRVNDLSSDEDRKALIVAIPMMVGSKDPAGERRKAFRLAMRALTQWAPESLRLSGWETYASEMETVTEAHEGATTAQTLLERLEEEIKSKRNRSSTEAEEILTMCTMIATCAQREYEENDTEEGDTDQQHVRRIAAGLAGELAAKAFPTPDTTKGDHETSLAHEALRTIRELTE